LLLAFPPTPARQLPAFTDVAATAGIRFQQTSGGAAKDYILEAQGAGVAWLDFNNDGWMDLYLVNGGRWEDFASGRRSVRNALFQNKGDGTFSDVTAKAGVAGQHWGMGAVAGDIDNDGWVDLYVCNFGPNALYRNQGDGTFADITEKAGVGDPRWSSSAAFLDYDADGWLDLYVANYLEFDARNPPPPRCDYRGIAVHCGPKGMTASPDRLYRNRGDGTFEDASVASGIAAVAPAYGLGVVAGDTDNDGDADLYVANDSMGNFLFENQGNGRFSETGALAGVAYDEDGRAQAGMGVDLGDYDRDGWLDIFVTNFSDDHNTLYRNLGNRTFRDVSYPSGVGAPSWQFLAWGTEFFDFDHDGWEDLFVANGHIYPQVDRYQIGTSYLQRPQLYRNLGNSKFSEIGAQLGTAMTRAGGGRGAAFADFDNDGDIDVAVNHLDGAASLLRNDGGNRAGRWIQFELERSRHRALPGARITIEHGAARQLSEVKAGSSYQSCSDPRVHFGVGKSQVVDRVKVRWPGGTVQTFSNVATNRFWKLREGGKLE